MSVTTDTLKPGPAKSTPGRKVPRAGLREVLTGIGPLLRPGAGRSSLLWDRERVVIELPGRPPLIITSSPEDAKAVFADREGALSFGQMLRRFTPHPVLFGEDNLVFREGDDHLRERRLIAPPFHGESLKAYEQAMADLALRRLGAWPINEPLAFLKLGKGLALDVMMTVIFGVSERERTERLERAMLHYCAATESPLFMGLGVLSVMAGGRWPPLPRLARTAAAVDQIVLEEIAERRSNDSRPDDCLTMFLDINEAEGRPKSDLMLAADMRGLMLAGYETTAVTLAWVAETLVHEPEAMGRVEEGIEKGDDDYLDAVITEVMRLRPAFPATGRVALEDAEVNGTRVRRGTAVTLAILALHERPDIYPEPLEFRPERFLGSRPGTYTWLPFGGGTHRCLGAAFSLFETRVLIRTLLANRTLRAVEDGREAAARSHPMLVPSKGAQVMLGPRG